MQNRFSVSGNIDPYDFTEFLEDELDNKFDLLLEDDSAQMVSQYHSWAAGFTVYGR